MKFFRAYTSEKEYGLYESTSAVKRIYKRLREEAGKRPLTEKESTKVGLSVHAKKNCHVVLDGFFHIQKLFLNSPPTNTDTIFLDFE